MPDVPFPLLESVAVQKPAELMASAGGTNEAGGRSERRGHAQVVCELGEGLRREKRDGERGGGREHAERQTKAPVQGKMSWGAQETRGDKTLRRSA